MKILKERSGVLAIDVAEQGHLIKKGTPVVIQAVTVEKDLSVRVCASPESVVRLNYFDTDIDLLIDSTNDNADICDPRLSNVAP